MDKHGDYEEDDDDVQLLYDDDDDDEDVQLVYDDDDDDVQLIYDDDDDELTCLTPSLWQPCQRCPRPVWPGSYLKRWQLLKVKSPKW